MIIYRKAAQLRIRRSVAPEPPWWYATAIAPYGARRSRPLAIDYLELRATSGERAEVTVAGAVRDELERLAGKVEAPVLVDAAGMAEAVFRRGAEALALLAERNVPATALVSTRGALPDSADMIALAAWPVEMERIESHAAELRGRAWGMVIPVIFPLTTGLDALDGLAEVASRHEARFLAAVSPELDAAARQAIARSLTLPEEEEIYQHLFHSDLEPLQIATERHIAALAAAGRMEDFVVPPQWERKTNWNAAILLTLTATRLLAMETDTELAGTLARSARVVAELEKPLERIAEAASLSIIEALDEISAGILTGWLERGSAPFVDRVNERWRLRRDAGMRDESPSPSS
ncbi:MAG TPA: hypothetical protein VNA04_13585 [Thermoanaerobaculia bacterium]|nr:hypothetical protein [Thermoanaerobaculia bacterium]